MSPPTHARADENKLEKVGPTFSSSVGDFGRLYYAKNDKISKIQLYNSNPQIHYQDRFN